MIRAASILGALACYLLACSDAEEPTLLLNAGDFCHTNHRSCASDTSLRVCEERVWVQIECSQICSQRGPAWIAAGCEGECQCVLADPDGCTPGQASCIDADTVQSCSDEQVQVETDCGERCAELGLESLACRADELTQTAACWCSIAGTACRSEPPRCVDDSQLARCVAGSWQLEDCTQACGGVGVCDPFSTPSSCRCG